jgi:hypothetical protein
MTDVEIVEKGESKKLREKKKTKERKVVRVEHPSQGGGEEEGRHKQRAAPGTNILVMNINNH